MTVFLSGIVGILCVVLTPGAIQESRKTEKTNADGPKIGDAAPDFTLKDSSGKSHKLSDYRGKIVVIEWVSPDCPWSIKAAERMKQTAGKYSAQKVVWLGIDSHRGHTAAEVEAYTREKGLSYPILLDPEGSTGRAFGAKVTPHMFVIDKDGKLAYNGAIGDRQRNYVAEALDELTAGKPVTVSTTKPVGCDIKYKQQ